MAMNVDGVLKEWGERLFYGIPKKGRRSRTITGIDAKPRSGTYAQQLRSPKVVKATIRAAARRAPEVMVKISGAGKGMRQVRAHLDYISRNGQLVLEDQNGEQIVGKAVVRDLASEWQYGLFGIPEDGRRRETFNIVLSMPPGTNRHSVREAAAEFGQKVFGEERPYVFVAHDDEKHPHVHLCVKSLGLDGKRLNPRKADLQLWREQFAESLRNHGVEACATSRIARGARRRVTSQFRHHHPAGAAPRPSANQYPSERGHVAAYAALAASLVAAGGEGPALAVELTKTVRRMGGVGQLPELGPDACRPSEKSRAGSCERAPDRDR